MLACVSSVAAQSTTLTRSAHGFSLAIPSGWIEKADPDAATILRKAQPEVAAMVLVQTERAPAAVTDVLANAAVKLKTDTSRHVVSSSFEVVLDRPALVAVLEDETTRYRLTLLPRDEGDRSQVFYGVMALAPKALFAKSVPIFDRIVAGFRIVPMAASGPTRSGPAASRAQVAPAPSAIDRAKAIERLLAPKSRP